MLTLEKLKQIEEGTIFETGITVDSEDGLNLCRTGKQLCWVAVRGGGQYDWAIYAGLASSSVDNIKACGDKVVWEDNIRRCVPCDDETFKHYRR